jgi:hypothetical protein
MWVSLNTENYKNRRWKAKKMCRAKKKNPHDPKVLEHMEEAHKRNETKFCIIAHGIKAGFQ